MHRGGSPTMPPGPSIGRSEPLHNWGVVIGEPIILFQLRRPLSRLTCARHPGVRGDEFTCFLRCFLKLPPQRQIFFELSNDEQRVGCMTIPGPKRSTTEWHNALLDEAILRCAGGRIDLLSASTRNMIPSRTAVREALEKLTPGFDPRAKWPSSPTIRMRIRKLQGRGLGANMVRQGSLAKSLG
jgi:hypothetical protein